MNSTWGTHAGNEDLTRQTGKPIAAVALSATIGDAEKAKIDANPQPAPSPPDIKPSSHVTMDLIQWEQFKMSLEMQRARAEKAEADIVKLRAEHNEVLAAIAAPVNLVRALGGLPPMRPLTIGMILLGKPAS